MTGSTGTTPETRRPTEPRIGLVWAEARGGAIGRDNTIPWHLPEDLAHFKEVTLGAPVVMGRRTWDSLPERFRPLPGRENIVVSRNPDAEVPGARLVASLDAALEGAPERVWIIGGGELYREAMTIAHDLYVTKIDAEIEGADTFAPKIGADWQLADPGESRTAENGLTYRFEHWVRGAER